MHVGISKADPSTIPDKVNPLGLVAILGSNLLIFLGLFSLAPALPFVKSAFAGAANLDFLTQMVGASSGFAFAIGCLLIGPVISRFGYRSVYLISLLLFGGAGASGALLHSLPLIIVTRVIAGMASAAIVNAALVAVGQLLAPAAQARTLGLQSFIGAVVGIVGFPIMGQLAGMDWRLPFAADFVALLFVPLVLTLPTIRVASAAAEPLATARGPGPVVAFTGIFGGTTLFVAMFFAPLFLAEHGVKDAALLSIPPLAGSIGGAIGSGGFVFVRRRFALAGTFTVALATTAVGLVITSLTVSVWGVGAGSLISMIGAGMIAPTLNNAAITASPDNPAPALGLVNALYFGSLILFPLVAGPVEAAVGGSRMLLLGCAALSALFALFFIAGGRWRMMPADPAATEPATT